MAFLGSGTFGEVRFDPTNEKFVIKRLQRRDEWSFECNRLGVLLEMKNSKEHASKKWHEWPLPLLAPGFCVGVEYPSYMIRTHAIRGGSAQPFVTAGDYDRRRILQTLSQVLRACRILAENGYAHLDIAPDNVLYHSAEYGHRAVLIDVGFMQRLGVTETFGKVYARTARYVRGPEDEGVVTLYSDPEAILYMGLYMFGVDFERITQYKLNWDKLREISVAQNVPPSLLYALHEIRQENSRILVTKFDSKRWDEIETLFKRMWGECDPPISDWLEPIDLDRNKRQRTRSESL